MKQSLNPTIMVRLDPADYERLRSLAEAQTRSMSNLVKRLILLYLKEQSVAPDHIDHGEDRQDVGARGK